ncbi:Dual specificity mitogen-activated protein kinase kinase 1 [Phytophthora nicotianae]|uniref:Dual specificity mitogen-activated protein kinase kinase 1 n=1 Tax=Phytophthora nicotianae TaxID=4792 RepID=A0A0W8DPS4_PHYNI|nr:Dual specificity mitogen-activated protein kinase kinase 1 [Phytophthora nicotianae]
MFSSRGASQSAKGKRKAMNDIRSICLRLLVRLAVRSGPANIVLDTLAKKAQADSFEQYSDVDTISELDYHIASIIRWVDPNGDILGDFGNEEVCSLNTL